MIEATTSDNIAPVPQQKRRKRQGANGRKTTPKTLAGRERQRQALQLRTAGYSFDQIAEQLGYADRASAYNAVRQVMQRNEAVDVEERRLTEDARMDALTRAVWPSALRGDPRAVLAAVEISKQRRKLWGIDLGGAGVQINVQQSQGQTQGQGQAGGIDRAKLEAGGLAALQAIAEGPKTVELAISMYAGVYEQMMGRPWTLSEEDAALLPAGAVIEIEGELVEQETA